MSWKTRIKDYLIEDKISTTKASKNGNSFEKIDELEEEEGYSSYRASAGYTDRRPTFNSRKEMPKSYSETGSQKEPPQYSIGEEKSSNYTPRSNDPTRNVSHQISRTSYKNKIKKDSYPGRSFHQKLNHSVNYISENKDSPNRHLTLEKAKGETAKFHFPSHSEIKPLFTEKKFYSSKNGTQRRKKTCDFSTLSSAHRMINPKKNESASNSMNSQKIMHKKKSTKDKLVCSELTQNGSRKAPIFMSLFKSEKVKRMRYQYKIPEPLKVCDRDKRRNICLEELPDDPGNSFRVANKDFDLKKNSPINKQSRSGSAPKKNIV